MPIYCEKSCKTCGYFHLSDNFECEYWGDLSEDTTTCHMWIEGELPHNLKYRIQQLEDNIAEIHKELRMGLWVKK